MRRRRTPAARFLGRRLDAYEVGGSEKRVARARVEVILGGCGLRETYEQNDGLVGESFTTYDAPRKLWHQTWLTNRGRLLTIEGGFQGDSLTLQGSQLSSDGRDENCAASGNGKRAAFGRRPRPPPTEARPGGRSLRHSLPAPQGETRFRGGRVFRRPLEDRRRARHGVSGGGQEK
jgi:hypothetical protein